MKIDYKLLRETCLNPIESFESFGEVQDTIDGMYIFKDNGSKILGVAHLDTVLNMNHFHRIDVNGDSIVINAQLDDRLGVYTLAHLLPTMGVNFDLLLTEGEEQGLSTAAHFETTKEYNWIFSFDRRGGDVVLYQFDSKVINKALEGSKFKIGQGTFSDIAFLDHLGCKGFNVGCGYHGEHSDMCYANMTEYKSQVKRFVNFYHRNSDTHYKHTYKPSYKFPVTTGTGNHYTMNDYNSRFHWGDYDDLYCYLCNSKRGKHQIIEDIWLCDSCFNDAALCAGCQDVYYSHEISDGLCMNCTRFEGMTGED